MGRPKLAFLGIFWLLLFTSFSCDKDEDRIIVPDDGYEWPAVSRDYWPTEG